MVANTEICHRSKELSALLLEPPTNHHPGIPEVGESSHSMQDESLVEVAALFSSLGLSLRDGEVHVLRH